jgi:CRISPR/Cas system CSM-associated protein Csm3 (group 7 of RAMP superfamily)
MDEKEEYLKELPESEQLGIVKVFKMPLKITVKEGSFLHIGGSPSPLTEKSAPIFSVDGKPVIPATSFKGAFRYQVEQLLIARKDELTTKLKITDSESIKPCIPATDPTKAEKMLVGLYRKQLRENRRRDILTEACWMEATRNRVDVPPNGFCPVCYFFGGAGLMGLLRIPNFWPETGEHLIDQTSIRIDRETGTAAHRAIVTSEQVKPKTAFDGTLEIIAEQGSFEFGRSRTVGEKMIDIWLTGTASDPIEEVQLLLINEILIPALNNIAVLGGQKSKGAGRVTIELGG